jgi:Glyoxalase/Bleomycin resistance protein/Dioxygenase superfamily
VVEFLVEDVEAAAEELRTAGVPIVFGPEHADDGGLAWVQFRAPDGNLYGSSKAEISRPPPEARRRPRQDGWSWMRTWISSSGRRSSCLA